LTVEIYLTSDIKCKGFGDSGSDFLRPFVGWDPFDARRETERGNSMAYCLPKEAERYVDATSTLNSIRNLAAAVERGELGISALVTFAKAAGSGETPRFAATRPVPLDMLKAIRENPEEPPRKIVYAGVASGRWTMDDAERYEENEAVLSERRKKKIAPTRGVYLTKHRRGRSYRPSTDNRFVPKVSLDAVLRPGVSDGAARCLNLIMSIAGKATEITTYTSSLATTLGKTARTVRNYFIQLEGAGLISRRPGRQYNTVHITIHDDCRPDAYVEPNDIKAFKMARKSTNAGLHLMAMTVVMTSMEVHQDAFATSDRRKEISVFNRDSNSLMSKAVGSLHSPATAPKASNARAVGLRPPTTHSTLLVDPRKPLQGKRPYRRSTDWTSPSGFNRLAALQTG
jgi:hypothetical protein